MEKIDDRRYTLYLTMQYLHAYKMHLHVVHKTMTGQICNICMHMEQIHASLKIEDE